MKSQVESLLFVSTKPMTANSLASSLKKVNSEATPKVVEELLVVLKEEYSSNDKGISLIESGGQYQFVSSAENAELIKTFVKDERTGELSQPSLETLTIVAYRGPLSKPHIEQVRGVNCSLILRNLMIRGLVQTEEVGVELMYSVTPEFLKFLGLSQVSALPNYDKLHSVENLEQFLEDKGGDASNEEGKVKE